MIWLALALLFVVVFLVAMFWLPFALLRYEGWAARRELKAEPEAWPPVVYAFRDEPHVTTARLIDLPLPPRGDAA